jgi:hypothetical protein
VSSMSGDGMRAADFGWHARVCAGKLRFQTRGEAKAKAKQTKSRHDSSQRPYLCPVCERWHLKTLKDTQG